MPGAESQFDGYADDYEGALDQGLAVSGEKWDFFAKGRLTFVGECLRRANVRARKVMDFGCGTGAAAPMIRELLGAETIVGVDESAQSIRRASEEHRTGGISFSVTDGFAPGGDFDLVYTNGVFHHIPLAQRSAAFRFINGALRAGGLLAFWENNPWSPGARYVMSRIPFDRDAIMISARRTAKLAEAHGFRVVRTDYHFLFPAALRVLRSLERFAQRLPFGAQYQVLCEKL